MALPDKELLLSLAQDPFGTGMCKDRCAENTRSKSLVIGWNYVISLTTILNLNASIKLATFDLSKDVLNSIKAGDMLFAIDQQQFLQGYLPVVFLTYDKLYGLVPGGGQPVLTGPGIVDKTNVDTVLANTGTTR